MRSQGGDSDRDPASKPSATFAHVRCGIPCCELCPPRFSSGLQDDVRERALSASVAAARPSDSRLTRRLLRSPARPIAWSPSGRRCFVSPARGRALPYAGGSESDESTAVLLVDGLDQRADLLTFMREVELLEGLLDGRGGEVAEYDPGPPVEARRPPPAAIAARFQLPRSCLQSCLPAKTQGRLRTGSLVSALIGAWRSTAVA